MNKHQKLGYLMLFPILMIFGVLLISLIIIFLLLPLTYLKTDPWITIVAYSSYCILGYLALGIDLGDMKIDE